MQDGRAFILLMHPPSGEPNNFHWEFKKRLMSHAGLNTMPPVQQLGIHNININDVKYNAQIVPLAADVTAV